ncbi:MAG: hypothetical protein VX278_04380 [Myxococcota bacterium]|nr:hypothetical protein [Myxococcota bacterium]
MTPYKNLSQKSGVKAYEILEEGIRVQFVSGEIYYYSNTIPGTEHIDTMKKLAEEGKGLATYISQKIREKFDTKESK